MLSDSELAESIYSGRCPGLGGVSCGSPLVRRGPLNTWLYCAQCDIAYQIHGSRTDPEVHIMITTNSRGVG